HPLGRNRRDSPFLWRSPLFVLCVEWPLPRLNIPDHTFRLPSDGCSLMTGQPARDNGRRHLIHVLELPRAVRLDHNIEHLIRGAEPECCAHEWCLHIHVPLDMIPAWLRPVGVDGICLAWPRNDKAMPLTEASANKPLRHPMDLIHVDDPRQVMLIRRHQAEVEGIGTNVERKQIGGIGYHGRRKDAKWRAVALHLRHDMISRVPTHIASPSP